LLVANDGAPWSCQLPVNVALLRQAKNIGVGAAYNLAAHWAREQGATHLLLLDQDGVPAPGMIGALMEISLAALADIGPFDESLFIEHVDTEWAPFSLIHLS
jgi:GT2 family glycosyltransferase